VDEHYACDKSMVIPTPGPRYSRVRDQYNRVLRWYERFEKIHNGLDKRGFEHKKDDILAFFINCHQLKDWIKNDTDVSKTKVEKFVSKNDCLKYCADIANGAKHPSLEKGPRIANKLDTLRVAVSVDRDNKKAIPFLIIRDSQGNIKDTFEIATEAVQKWEEFFQKHELFEKKE